MLGRIPENLLKVLHLVIVYVDAFGFQAGLHRGRGREMKLAGEVAFVIHYAVGRDRGVGSVGGIHGIAY
jgi:hypothetical protein